MATWFDLIMPTVPDSYEWEPNVAHHLDTASTLRVRAADLLRVRPQSKRPYRAAVHRLARFLQREEGYDFPPYQEEHPMPESVAYLLLNDTQTDGRAVAVGCALMDIFDWKDLGEVRTLAWVWLHPFVRQKGWLTALWPILEAENGDFLVQGPFSDGMYAFLKKRGWDYDAWLARNGYPPRQDKDR